MSRFIIKRTDKKLPPETKEVIKKIIKAENKIIARVRKKAKLQRVELSEIHTQLTLYAMREHLKTCIKEIQKNKLP